MNLTKLKVQEMNQNELVNVDGGDFWDDLLDTAIYAASVVVTAPAHFIEGLVDGTNTAVEAHNNVYH